MCLRSESKSNKLTNKPYKFLTNYICNYVNIKYAVHCVGSRAKVMELSIEVIVFGNGLFQYISRTNNMAKCFSLKKSFSTRVTTGQSCGRNVVVETIEQ